MESKRVTENGCSLCPRSIRTGATLGRTFKLAAGPGKDRGKGNLDTLEAAEMGVLFSSLDNEPREQVSPAATEH